MPLQFSVMMNDFVVFIQHLTGLMFSSAVVVFPTDIYKHVRYALGLSCKYLFLIIKQY